MSLMVTPTPEKPSSAASTAVIYKHARARPDQALFTYSLLHASMHALG